MKLTPEELSALSRSARRTIKYRTKQVNDINANTPRWKPTYFEPGRHITFEEEKNA